MKLARVGDPGVERSVVVYERGLVDVTDVVGELDAPLADAKVLARLAAMESAGDLDERPAMPAEGLRYGPPVHPSKIVCIGLNYADHAREGGMELPAEPVVFMKAPNCLVGPDDDVVLPPGSEKTDYEVELAVVIGSRAAYLPDPAAAAAVIAGYTISDDVSERHWQLERGGSWDKGKCFATFNPLGPWLVTPDTLGDPGKLGLRLRVNGEVRQDSSTCEMAFDVAHLVWYVSQFMTLEPGDVINTGTPAGVGLGLNPPRYLADGDIVEVEIDGLGRQRHRLRAYEVRA